MVWTQAGLWVYPEARGNRTVLSALDVVCERKTKGNYKMFLPSKTKLPFIETGKTIVGIDWCVGCKLVPFWTSGV